MFLENEVWELCPVKANFSLVNLQVGIHAQSQANAHKFSIRDLFLKGRRKAKAMHFPERFSYILLCILMEAYSYCCPV